MPYRFLPDESVTQGVRRITVEQIDRAVAALTGDGHGEGDLHEGVHEARKRGKKIRAVLRLVRPALGATYADENARFRDAARLVSDTRDATAVIETFDAHLAEPFATQLDDRRLQAVRDVLVDRRDELTAGTDLDALVAEVVDRLRAGRQAATGWELTDDGWAAIAPGLAKTYARGRRAMAHAYEEGTTEAFHEWRKRVKYHRYHMKLLKPLWPEPLAARRSACHQLSDYLGDDHDLAVFRGVLEREAGRFDDGDLRVLVAVLDHRRGELQASARPEGARVYAEPEDRLTERFGAYWDSWCDEQRARPAFARPVASHPAA